MIVQELYWKDYDRSGIVNQYKHTFNGIRQYINDTITDEEQRQLALLRVEHAETIRKNKMKQGSDNYGGYPVLYVFHCVLAGQYKREIMPRKVPSPEDIEYEI